MKLLFLPRLFAAALLLSPALPASAVIPPDFSLKDCALIATDIVIAAQGQKSGDPVTILEIWKGGLKPGATIQIAGFVRIADLPVVPTTHPTPFAVDPSKNPITGTRIVLFLQRTLDPGSPSTSPLFKGSAPWGILESAVWIEHDHAYAFQEPEDYTHLPSVLLPLNQTEAELKQQTLALLAAKGDLRQAQSIANPTEHSWTGWFRSSSFAH